MGAVNFINFETGKTAREAFDKLVAKAEKRYGDNPYNGTISTTSLSSKPAKVIRKRYTKNAMKEAAKVAESDDWGEKWESRAIDCGATKGEHMWAFYGLAAC